MCIFWTILFSNKSGNDSYNNIVKYESNNFKHMFGYLFELCIKNMLIFLKFSSNFIIELFCKSSF
jgi:hypothetical protein